MTTRTEIDLPNDQFKMLDWLLIFFQELIVVRFGTGKDCLVTLFPISGFFT